MNMLGLQYTLTCEVLNKEMLDEDLVITYRAQQFPIEPGEGHRYEQADDELPTGSVNKHGVHLLWYAGSFFL